MSNKKLTNLEVLNLNDLLEQHKEELNKLRGANFAWTLSRNIKKIQAECKTILANRRITTEYEAYEKQRVELCEFYTNKDEAGNPKIITVNGRQEYDLDTENPEFKEKMASLREANKDALDRQKKVFEEFNAMLKQENTSLNLLSIELSMVPSEISGELMNVVELFIKE